MYVPKIQVLTCAHQFWRECRLSLVTYRCHQPWNSMSGVQELGSKRWDLDLKFGGGLLQLLPVMQARGYPASALLHMAAGAAGAT